MALAEMQSPGAAAAFAALARFEVASEQLLEARTLLRRVDRKCLFPIALLPELLERLVDDYRVLPAAGALAATYQSHYLDTGGRRMYHDHRRGRFPRLKVRVRHHVDRRLTFLEIKQRRYGAFTAKTRLPRPFEADWLDDEASRFVSEHAGLSLEALHPSASIAFRRITLLGERTAERVTVDSALELAVDGRVERLPRLVILEVKQERYSNGTGVIGALRRLRVRERAVSKYCLAVARLTQARCNTLKPALRAAEPFSV